MRRIRRLWPALIIVLFSSFAAAYTWFLPSDFEQFAKSLLATTLCLSNLFFAHQYGDYFAADATTKPLLHTWSLAEEEQFYLLYPFLLLRALKQGFGRRAILGGVSMIALVSFAAACAGGYLFPAYTFYLLPSRAWELMLGAVVALSIVPPFYPHVISIIAAILIISGIAGVRLISFSLLPAPLLACLGTALMIHANCGTKTFFKTTLSSSTIVAIGLISYSLYLWHWPVIIFYRYAISENFSMADVTIILAATVSASVISYVLIEQPIRKRRLLERRLTLLPMAISASVCLILLSVAGIVTKGYPTRLPPNVLELANGRYDSNPARDQCIEKEPANVLSGSFCRLGKNVLEPTFVIWGDSQADAWMPTFNDLAARNDKAGLFAAHGGCPPLLGIRRVNQDPSQRCTQFNEAVFAKAESIHATDVVLIGRWSWYIFGVEKGGQEEGSGAIIANTDEDDNGAAAETNRKRVFQAAVTRTVQRLRDIGARIWIIDQPPTYTVDVPKYLAYAALRGETATGRARTYIQQQHSYQLEVFRSNNVEVVDLTAFFCPRADLYCRMTMDGRSLYSDFNHLSVFGARSVAKWASLSSFLQRQEQSAVQKSAAGLLIWPS